jgi:hypothetical protein
MLPSQPGEDTVETKFISYMYPEVHIWEASLLRVLQGSVNTG